MLDKCLVNSETWFNRHSLWSQVADPTDALVLSLRRIGWKLTSAMRLADDQGHSIDLAVTPPGAVIKAVRVGAARAGDRLALMRESSPWIGAIFWDGISKRLTGPGRRDWTVRQQRALASVVTNAAWTQRRLHRHGLAPDDHCRICLQPGANLWHRCYSCIGHDAERRTGSEQRLRSYASNARAISEQHDEMFARVIFPAPAPSSYGRCTRTSCIGSGLRQAAGSRGKSYPTALPSTRGSRL